MSPTADQLSDLRADLDVSEDVFSDVELERIWERAAGKYSETDEIEAHARVVTIRQLLASSAKLVSYKQNQSSENQSDIFKHLKDLLNLWSDSLADCIAANAGAAAVWGTTRRAPAQRKDTPSRY